MAICISYGDIVGDYCSGCGYDRASCICEDGDERPGVMGEVAVYARVLQFRAGPNESRFYACEAHHGALARGDVGGLFFPTAAEPIQAVDPADEQQCYWCREP